MNQIINGDSLEILKTLQADSIDLVCTDPPYGYSFMGKDWDKAVPSVELWREVLRVLKPGAFAFIMSAPRQDVLAQTIVRLGEAGFDTSYTSIYWAYASGFPKAANISKRVDKRLGAEREVIGTKAHSGKNFADPQFVKQGSMMQTHERATRTPVHVTAPATEQAKALDGSYGGFQPKPAVEIVIVVMKPLSEKSYVEQAMANGKGITWLDDARIPYDEGDYYTSEEWKTKGLARTTGNTYGKHNGSVTDLPEGRFPANLLVSDDILNDGRTTQGRAQLMKADKGGTGNSLTFPHKEDEARGYNDEGSFSRYFDLDKWAQRTFPFLITPKASQGEKNEGLEDLPIKQTTCGGGMNNERLGHAYGSIKAPAHNFHPTVKPLKLMSYLITLGSRKGDLVLDPFCGSGTTCVAAKMQNRNYIGIELNAEYAEIARKRIATEVQTTLF